MTAPASNGNGSGPKWPWVVGLAVLVVGGVMALLSAGVWNLIAHVQDDIRYLRDENLKRAQETARLEGRMDKRDE